MNSPSFGVGLGRVIRHLKARQIAEAEAICQWMLDILPQQGQVLNQQGYKLFQDGSDNAWGATQLLEQAVACHPDEPKFLQNLAIALDAQGRHSVARRVRAALTVAPKTAFMPALAQTIECIKTGKTVEAEAICQRMLETLPYQGPALNQLGCEAIKAGQLAEGVSFLSQAVAHHPEETQFHHNLAIALDAQGRASEAQSIRTALTKAPYFTVPAHIVNNFAAWGAASGYEVRPIPQIPFAAPYSVNIVSQSVNTLAESVFQFAQTMAHESHKPAVAVCTENMRLVHWHWGVGGKAMIPMSQNNDIFIHDSFWLRFLPFIHSLTDDGRCTIDCTPFAPTRLRVKEECFFLGGISHFGHLLGDHLPKLQALQSAGLPNGLPIVVTHVMSDWERDIMNCMGFSDRIVELEMPTQSCIIEFDRAWMADGFSMRTRYDFLRSTFARCRPPIGLGEKRALPSRVYIARAPTSDPNRIINEKEVHDYVSQRGFTIVYGEKLNTQQKAELFGQADIIIAEPGSAAFNYIAFAHQDCILVTLMTSDTLTPSEIMLKAGWQYSIPLFDSIIFAIGQHPVDYKASHIHFPALYPINVMATAIDQAEEMLNRHPS